MISLSGLNSMQRQAAETTEGPVLILAGAGSGKTRTITYRVSHMIDNLGYKPQSLLGISFTNKAAKEMRERVLTLLGPRKSRGLTLCTFHSLGIRILKKEIEHLGHQKNFSIYDTSEQTSIIREALKHYNAEKSFDRQEILAKIGWLKNLALRENDWTKSPYFDPENPFDLAVEYCYHYYQDKLKFFNAIDFDDILFMAVKLFKEFPDIAKKYSQQYQYIMVDEYQDTNPLQFELIRGLTSTHNNLCVVGDDDQSIYSFRGADIRNILEFEKTFPNAVVIKLEENYRSTNSILKLANHIIKENKGRRDKTLWSQKESPVLPLLWPMGNTDHEAQVVAEEIAKYQAQGHHLGDIAILYRSKTQVDVFEDELKMAGIPYTIIGGQKFYEKKEVKDLIAYLSVLLNPRDELSLRRILNVPHRGIGTATLEKYLKKSKEEKLPLIECMANWKDLAEGKALVIADFLKLLKEMQEIFKTNELPQAITQLIERIDYLKYIDKSYDESPKQAERRKNDVSHFIESAARFVHFHKQNATLETFVERLMMQDSQDKENESHDDNDDQDVRPNQVTLMTLHSSKGLEYDIVYLVGMEEEMLPHKKTVKEGNDISEERRLCYVGITRAREKLIMTYCKQRKIYGKDVPRYPSRFVHELDDLGLFIKQDRTSFGHLAPEEVENYKKKFFSDLLSNATES